MPDDTNIINNIKIAMIISLHTFLDNWMMHQTCFDPAVPHISSVKRVNINMSNIVTKFLDRQSQLRSCCKQHPAFRSRQKCVTWCSEEE